MKFKIVVMLGLSLSILGGCASISEEDCQIGAWSEYGYEDGVKGKSSDRVSDYAKTCAEHGVKPDIDAYLASYERGIQRYCTYQQGYELGENGSSYNQACAGDLAADFAAGYDEGRVVYEIYQEHKRLISDYEDTVDALVETRRKLREDELTDDERRRLEKKEIRLEDRREDTRIDIRAFERLHDLPRYDFR